MTAETRDFAAPAWITADIILPVALWPHVEAAIRAQGGTATVLSVNPVPDDREDGPTLRMPEDGGSVGEAVPIGVHEQMVEVHIEWKDGQREIETQRPICRYCWYEGPDGKPRRADWPCDAVRLASGERPTDCYACPRCGSPLTQTGHGEWSCAREGCR